MTEVVDQNPTDWADDTASPQSYRAGRALALLNLVRDSRPFVLDRKAFQYLRKLIGSGAILIGANSQSTLELEAIA